MKRLVKNRGRRRRCPDSLFRRSTGKVSGRPPIGGPLTEEEGVRSLEAARAVRRWRLL
jgi:hypothetical protein